MGTTSYWLAEPHEPIPRRAFEGSPDVAVVGGGITGCSCALALAEAGLRVRVYDEREIAGGASGRNGGFALRGGAAPYPVTAESIGRERAASVWAWTEEELRRLAELAGDALRLTGSLRLAADAEERSELEDEYEALRDDGFAVEWRDELPAPLAGRYPGAIFHPPDAVLQPARLVRRVAALAAEAGVDFREHTRVESVEETGAQTVVVATDGYPSGLLGELEGLIVPTRGQVIATEPIPERLFEIPHYGRHGFDYWHQSRTAASLRAASGTSRCRTSSRRTRSLPSRCSVLSRSSRPRLVGRPLRVDYRWAGIFGMVFDFLPVVGRVPGAERVWVAGGYSGHGNVLGFACGRLVARAIQGDRDPLLDLFEPVAAPRLVVRKTGIPERGFRSRERAKDLKRGRFAAAVSVLSHQAAVSQAASATHCMGSPAPRSVTPASTRAPQTSVRRCAANVRTWATIPPYVNTLGGSQRTSTKVSSRRSSRRISPTRSTNSGPDVASRLRRQPTLGSSSVVKS